MATSKEFTRAEPIPAPDVHAWPFSGEALAAAIAKTEKELQARRLGWLKYSLTGALMITLGTLSYPLYKKWCATRTSVVPDAAVLALRVERLENELRVSWHPNPPVVNHAKGAVLSIRDGDTRQQKLPLDLEQLRNGSVLYTPANRTVRFHLEVTGLDNKKTSETVLAWTTRADSHGRPAAKRRPAVAPSTRDRKQFTPPEAGQHLRELARVVLLDPPPPSWTAPQASAFFEPFAVTAWTTLFPARTTASPPDASTGQTSNPQPSGAVPGKPEPLSEASAYVAARPIHQALPNPPHNVRGVAISEAEIQVKVKVDKAGRVVNAEAVASTSLVSNSLVLVTQEAARLWRFAPAMRGNDPVASEVLLIFRFRPKITVN